MTQLTPEQQLPVEGLIQQELITYRIVNGHVHKTTVTRKFQKGADYIDSTHTEVLYAAN
tara:strand:- start:347 stop:523 length:177 start_codon:yes stop_codon:yes gene_type:complete